MQALVSKYKYELFLFALIQHLFIGIFLKDMPFYTTVIWPINMLVIGLASVGLFLEKNKIKVILKNILFVFVFLLPIGHPFFGHIPHYFLFLNGVYVLFFGFIFYELLKFLLRPSYVNADIISAAACGYFLLIEIATFLLQFFQYLNPHSFKGIDESNPATIFMDLVYFCSITITSIGFGDITPTTHHTKLIASLFGIGGQLYTVVLVGILISKFTDRTKK